jgi:hypothetical protein
MCIPTRTHHTHIPHHTTPNHTHLDKPSCACDLTYRERETERERERERETHPSCASENSAAVANELTRDFDELLVKFVLMSHGAE